MNNVVLVVGGAGFIGSHMVKHLLANDRQVVVLDNLSNGHQDAVLGGTFIEGDMADRSLLNDIFTSFPIGAVMDFASFIQVGESVEKPLLYYHNNFYNTLTLLETMLSFGVKHLVFSSTAAIFGEPQRIPIDEEHPKAPLNPYGESKWMVERVLRDFDRAYGLKSACLRYFNAAGADPDGELGERHQPETHLIPLALEAAAGLRPFLSIHGTDYDTPDGTCIRDYVHVADLCRAHLAALNYLGEHNRSLACNLGNGVGFSVREVINAVERVTGCQVPLKEGARRAGDPPRLVADSRLANRMLGWAPQYAGLESMVAHAWSWQQRLNLDSSVDRLFVNSTV